MREGKTYSATRTSILLLTLGSFAFLISCTDPGLLNADQNFSKSELQTIYSDTFTVKTSTVWVDSIPTSNTGGGTLLVGGYQDNLIGKVNASTYFQIGYTSEFAPKTNWVFDSARLILPYNKFYYGDTTKTLNFTVSELVQDIRLRQRSNSGDVSSFFSPLFALYNTSNVKFSNTPIVTKAIKYTPKKESIIITLPKAFGQRFYDVESQIPGAVRNDFENTRNFSVKASWFISTYLKGLHIYTDANADASIAGFKIAGSVIRLYYTEKGESVQNLTRDFELLNNSNQFNSITADRSGTDFQSLTKMVAVPSTSTNNTTLIHSGVGIFTKLEFPSLKGFLNNDRISLIDAVLEIPAVQNTYPSKTNTPSILSLYTTNQNNLINGIVSSGSNQALSAQFLLDNEYQKSRYAFSLTSYVQTQLKSGNSTFSPIAVISPSFFSEVTRVVIGNRAHPTNTIKLKIYYSQYGTTK